MLEQLKTSLRISHNKLDDDLKANILACIEDLKKVGVAYVDYKSNSDDFYGSELQSKAIELYIKWQYDFNGKGEQFRKNYESLRDSMALSNLYNGGDPDV